MKLKLIWLSNLRIWPEILYYLNLCEMLKFHFEQNAMVPIHMLISIIVDLTHLDLYSVPNP